MISKPPGIRGPLSTSEINYEKVVDPIEALVRVLHQRLPAESPRIHFCSLLLRGMVETEQSIRAVLSAARRYEKDNSERTGRYVDACYLARPQVEATINGILLLHNFEEFGPKYQRNSWYSNLWNSLSSRDFYRGSDDEEDWWDRQLVAVRRQATDLELTDQHEAAVMAEFKGTTTKQQRVLLKDVKFPQTSEIVGRKATLLEDSKYKVAAELLWFEWKKQCHTLHAGLSGFSRRAFLRGERVEQLGGQSREYVSDMEIVYSSTVPSTTSILVLATCTAVEYFSADAELLDRVAQCWDPIKDGQLMAANLWAGWARSTLGILG